MNTHFTTNYIDPQSILVLNRNGEMKRLFCPFGVISKQQIDKIPPQTRMIVEEVGIKEDDTLCYIINGKSYKHHCFQLLILF